MKKIIATLMMLPFLMVSFGQKTPPVPNADTSAYSKTFMLIYNTTIKRCNAGGENQGKDTTAYRDMLFTIHNITDSGIIIKFNIWSYHKIGVTTPKSRIRLNMREKYNFISNANKKQHSPGEIQYFLIKKEDFKNNCITYVYPTFKHIDMSIGVLTVPFKLRSFGFANFTPNLSLGSAVYFQYKFRNGISCGVVTGISLTSIELDSASTQSPIAMNNTSRPALTPSAQFLFAYKSVNITLGLGWDYINTPSAIEKKWIYQGKRWYGIGVGINLFTATATPSPPHNSQSN